MKYELAIGRVIREAVNGRNVMEFDERAEQAVHSFLGAKKLERNAVATIAKAAKAALFIAEHENAEDGIRLIAASLRDILHAAGEAVE